MLRTVLSAGVLLLVATTACSGDNADGSGGGGASSSSAGPSGSTSQSSTGSGGAPSGTYFPNGSWIYADISSAPVHPESDAITGWLQSNGSWGTGEMRIDFSIEVLEADASTPKQTFEPTSEHYVPACDLGPVPVPDGGALEGESGYECTTDGDCHLIVVDRSTNLLYEMWRADISGGQFRGGCLAVWDMMRVYPPEGRGEQCTSADAAGFPIAPMLFSADEVAAGEIAHAIRFILPNSRMRADVYTRPGTHAGAPSGPSLAPVYGSRWRLKSSFDVASLPTEGARVVARALQRYGMALADGGNIALTGQSDRLTTAKWDGLLDTRDLDSIQPTDFEVIDTGPNIALTYDCARTPE